MENRKKGLYTAKICRFCLSQDEPLISLFEKKQTPKNSVSLSLKILASIAVEVFPSEQMPPYICQRCNFFMDVVHNFKNICREADRSILDYVQNGTALEPIVYRQSLLKLFRYGSKPALVKIEGGATVEVSQSLTDSEDDDENVYNVKIGDGTEEEASACVKVVDKPQQKIKKDSDDVEVEVVGRRSGGDGCWPCDQCDCTYPLQQLLELHKMQKHRARTVACDTCDAKFFSKNDLATHALRHSSEMPFECIACGKRFRRNILLKRHEKFVHADLPQIKCDHCPASFLCMEELEAHLTRHKRVGERKWKCPYCDKRFYEQAAMTRHVDVVHESKPELACEYCPERFTSISKLTRHVRSHAGERPYPCKYCDKSFTKSHHYTRHVRAKHSAEARAKRGSLDEFRCEECTVSFPTQDELIYHSAIHATQNLTCPLCQEKFPDVDAVTTHIKSHVTGMEFMCDFCELVFTSKEKLDLHIDNVHEDELRSTQDLGQDESSMEMDGEEDEDNSINVKQEGDHMIIEIKKPDEFLLPDAENDSEDKANVTNSEESEPECGFMEQPPTPLPARPPPPPLTPAPAPAQALTPAPAVTASQPTVPKEPAKTNADIVSRSVTLIRKAEEVKRKQEPPPQEKKEKPRVESSSGGASDKSLRLLEKELQELQRTTKREEPPKTPAKSLESLRNRRPQLHTSTPKPRPIDDKKSQPAKSTPTEKKVPERRAIKENKKPDESKDTKINNVSKEEKETKAREDRDTKTKEDKDTKAREDIEKTKEEKDTKANVSKEESKEKSVVKNGANTSNNKSASDDSSGPVRRSSRPSKVKDYAKMVNAKTIETTPSDDDSDDDDDEEYIEAEEPRKMRQRAQKTVILKAKPAATTTTPARKRGRPRKDAAPVEPTPPKVKKNEKPENEDSEDSKTEKMETGDIEQSKGTSVQNNKDSQETSNTESSQPAAVANADQKPANVSPSAAPVGSTLKKVPIKALPPGVKPLPLPVAGKPEISEMQIGKKMVKVQKIVMTKAEVEAMAKKGLLEMKGGTMVLKAGVKIPTDPNALKSTLVGEGEKSAAKESPSKSTPTRCDLDEV